MADGLKNKEFKPDRQIEVTDRMVEAGAQVVESFAFNGMHSTVAKTIALEVYEAMISAKALGYEQNR